MRLLETRVEACRGAAARLVGVFEPRGGKPEELYVAVPEAFASFLCDGADAFVPALLVPCMEAGEDLAVECPVSPRLLSQLGKAQDILLSWYPHFRRVELLASPRTTAPAPRAPGVLALFSGGVDSYYTLLRSVHASGPHVARATHLVFAKGLEQTHAVLRDVESALALVRETACETGTELLPVDASFRDRFSVNYVGAYFGAALSATAHALANGAGTLLFPSSYSYAHLPHCGSHPLLDPLWSTERLEVVHQGAEASRADKLAALASEWPECLPRLRVCLENAGGGTNCGRCRKCVRTMVALEMLGVLGRATSFPARLPADADGLLMDEGVTWLEELQLLGRRVAPGSRAARLVDSVLRRRRRRAALRAWCENTPAVASGFDLLDRLRGAGRHRPD